VHSAPTFSGSGAIAPWHPAARTIVLHSDIFFDPTVTFDVGSTNVKSSNSVIIPAQFSRAFVFGLSSNEKMSNPASFAKLDGKRRVAASLAFGPRAEFDTPYGGTNLRGEGRGELYLPQLFKSVDVQAATIASGNPAIRDLLDLPTNGYAITPYFQFDAGGHVNSQTITNPKGNPSANISQYNIARLYLGVHGTAQLGRNTLNLDGSWVDLFANEIVPFTVQKITSATTISGLQPHAKATYSLFLDDTKHFAGTCSWENGRSAPSFQYLNKVTVGVQVIY
jgi:hypothetical protein